MPYSSSGSLGFCRSRLSFSSAPALNKRPKDSPQVGGARRFG